MNVITKVGWVGVKMAALSEAALSQIHLSGEVDCPAFKPHMLKGNMCVNCNKLINKHRPEAIPDNECLLQAIEYSQKGEKVPSCILQPEGGLGGLYHGGFKAVMNKEFLQKHHVTHIVNTAKGLEIFGPKYLTAVECNERELGISVLNMDWEDTEQYTITYSDLVKSSRFIHMGRMTGSVLVHCAQGKSRSSTAVIAYLMGLDSGLSYEQCVTKVKEQRKMAEPNPAFRRTLIEFSKSDELMALQQELK